MMNISENGLRLIKEFEGFVNHTYLDTAGVPTIGYGTTTINGQPVTAGMVLTEDQASDLILQQLEQLYVPAVNRRVTVPLTQNQFDALVSWTYNLGEGNLASSTMLRLLNQGNYDSVPAQMLRWCRDVSGHDLPGLLRRRTAEASLWNQD